MGLKPLASWPLCQLVGEVLDAWAGLPGPVAGMALSFPALASGGGVSEGAGRVVHGLLADLVLFLPAGSGTIQKLSRRPYEGEMVTTSGVVTLLTRDGRSF